MTVFVTQVAGEVIRASNPPGVRVSQLAVEVARIQTGVPVRVDQLAVEVIRPNVPPPPDVEFPECVAVGASRTPGWSTTMLETLGAWAHATQNWSSARHSYDVTLAVRTATDYAQVLDHFHEHRGRLLVFPFKDFLDFAATKTQGVALHVSGLDYQLYKRYGSVNPYDRRVTRPVEGTVTVYRTRAGVQSVIDPQINYSLGLVTCNGHEDGDTYQWEGEFRVPVRYANDKMPAVVVDREPGGGELLVVCEQILLVEHRE